jgi:hypothetical protein
MVFSITFRVIITLSIIRLQDEAMPNSFDHLWDFTRWDSIKSNKLNNEVTNLVLNSAIRTFDLLRVGVLEVLPRPVEHVFDRMGTNLLSPSTFHLQSVGIVRKTRGPLCHR